MGVRVLGARVLAACVISVAVPALSPQSSTPVTTKSGIPASEALTYSIEWRLINAGAAHISLAPHGQGSESKAHLESSGLVSKLYKIDDSYRVQMHDQFCASNSVFEAVEGKRRHETVVTFDRTAQKAIYVERDLLKNVVVHRAETEIPACVSDILGGLYKMRTIRLEPGQTAQLAVSDGKKSVSAKIEAQDREQVQTKAGTFKTIRYEVYVFNGILFKKSGRLQLWLTDDSRRMPVQFRARMAFPIGTITFQLDKEEHS